MSLVTNGISPKIIELSNGITVTEIKKLNVCNNGSTKTVWQKPYTLTISHDTKCVVTVGLRYTQYSVVAEVLTNGSNIYDGNYLDISIAAKSGYTASWTLNGVKQSDTRKTIQVAGNCNITATSTATTLALSRPIITGSLTYDNTGGFYYLKNYIQNTNNISVTALLTVYASGSKLMRNWSETISANTTKQCSYGELFSTGARVDVTFQCSGYSDATASKTFGNYTGDTYVDESSTTTTTT